MNQDSLAKLRLTREREREDARAITTIAHVKRLVARGMSLGQRLALLGVSSEAYTEMQHAVEDY